MTPTPYDGNAYCFLGDKEPDGFHVDMVQFPQGSFTIHNNVRVYTIAQTDVLVNAHTDQAHGMLDGPLTTTPDTETILVRNAVPIPFSLVATLLEARLSPILFWMVVIQPLLEDAGDMANYLPLINWAWAAITMTAQPAGAGGAAAPDDDPVICR